MQPNFSLSAVTAGLVDKSLAWRRGDLYQLHQIAQQFGREKLEQVGDWPTSPGTSYGSRRSIGDRLSAG